MGIDMKIRQRLVISFLIVITVPIILICAAGGALMNYHVNEIQQSYDVEADTVEMLINPLQVLNRLTRTACNRLQTVLIRHPEKFDNLDYIDSLNKELERKYSFLVVRKGKKFVYVGDKEEFELIENKLPAYGTDSSNIDGGFYVSGDNPALVKQQDFIYKDGTKGSTFVITNVNTILPQVQALAVQSVVAFILIICFTASILILWIYQGIIRPLKTLQYAAKQMSEGDLSNQIQVENDDEIGDLCKDIENMRIRLKELIEERLQYEEDSRELMSNISHDLKTPLTAIKGYAEGIMDGVADSPEKLDKYLKTIYNKANDMTALVDELSFYSKIDCNAVPYNFVCVNLDEYFSDCINELILDLEVKNIDIGYFNYVDKDQQVWIDAEQLKRVVNNIIGNSVKYLDKKKGLINIRIRDGIEHVQIEIEDNGSGIAKSEMPYIFDRFYRTDTSRNSSKGGTGLGLAISKKIIEDHGGKIWASGKESVGTSIYFTLTKCKYKSTTVETVEEKGIGV